MPGLRTAASSESWTPSIASPSPGRRGPGSSGSVSVSNRIPKFATIKMTMQAKHYPFWSNVLGAEMAVLDIHAFAQFSKQAPGVTLAYKPHGTGPSDKSCDNAPLKSSW
jgi:hypothetical protein